jgi:protein TonB
LTAQAPPGVRRVAGAITLPKVLSAPEPSFSESAKATKVSGKCLVYLQVAEDGSIDHVAILRPIGIGLNEQAIGAVRRYRFSPAMENGKPVRVELNVEVNFQIF